VHFAVGGLREARYAVSVFDPRGRLVRRWSGEAARGVAGAWDGRGGDGALVGSGVYFLRVEADGREAVTKAVVAR
jgi:hypothetical protein